ncbi:unnamed protein product (macronuclear) [Paramecium tetraurelia]|uniref:Uncharacterized protein n=1 Tax=Paramecium tetraurelia TaxID=5888 RepID=A0DA60_PARTE|nr:uncharacterized protein GSPATT00014834001 [Paramecium tetraurelia]CAK79927.1 unnamed protein product [Paramecium tetraurelia]|eukprot:XP_001447324.1 hypothetical protein (macronuclear) [Paramecium tetraurelia strain d4-2]
MKKSIVLLTLLIVLTNTQRGTLVTHYDLDGNLISEEIMAPIEDEITYYDSNESAIDSSMNQETQNQPNLTTPQESQDSASIDVPISTANTLEPAESDQQQTNLIGSSFEIQPVVNQQPKIETSIEQQHNLEQQIEGELHLQQVPMNQNLDLTIQQQNIPEPQFSKEQDDISIRNADTYLQPVVVTSDQMLVVQKDIDQQTNSSDINNSILNAQQTPDKLNQKEQEQSQNKEDQQNQPNTNEKLEENNLEAKQETTNKVIQDMPIQDSVIIQSGNEIHIAQNAYEIQSESLGSVQEQQENQKEQINIQTTNADDQFEVTQNFGRIIQDMVPESDEDTQILEQPEDLELQQKAVPQPSQIEEDINFNNEDEQLNNQVEKQAQAFNEDKQENQASFSKGNEQQEQQIETDVQEITQESTQAQEDIPEELKQNVNSLENNINKQGDMKINNPFEDDGLKLSSEIIQNQCIVIYSECEYQGLALEVCDSLKDIEQYLHLYFRQEIQTQNKIHLHPKRVWTDNL